MLTDAERAVLTEQEIEWYRQFSTGEVNTGIRTCELILRLIDARLERDAAIRAASGFRAWSTSHGFPLGINELAEADRELALARGEWVSDAMMRRGEGGS